MLTMINKPDEHTNNQSRRSKIINRKKENTQSHRTNVKKTRKKQKKKE